MTMQTKGGSNELMNQRTESEVNQVDPMNVFKLPRIPRASQMSQSTNRNLDSWNGGMGDCVMYEAKIDHEEEESSSSEASDK